MLVVAHNCVHGNDSRVKPEGNLHDFITRIKSRVLRRQSILRSRHISVAFTRVKRCVHCARFQGLVNIHAYYTGYYAWGLPVAVMHVPLRHIHLTLIARPRHETLIIACNSPLNARACTLIKRKFLKSVSFGSTLMSNEERYVLCNGCVTIRGKYTSCQGTSGGRQARDFSWTRDVSAITKLSKLSNNGLEDGNVHPASDDSLRRRGGPATRCNKISTPPAAAPLAKTNTRLLGRNSFLATTVAGFEEMRRRWLQMALVYVTGVLVGPYAFLK
jgi:hypothetical protein